MTDLPTETYDGTCLWHPERGFNERSFMLRMIRTVSDGTKAKGWRVVPVTITLTATGTGIGRETAA